MKLLKIFFVISMMLFLSSSFVTAGDFDWMRAFNIRAETDPSGLRARLESRFKVGDIEIKTVLGKVDNPADAYTLLRLGEMSNQPLDYVIEQYKANKGKGWGVLAKSLGIKPGSKDFKALKQGQDLYNDKSTVEEQVKSKGKRRK